MNLQVSEEYADFQAPWVSLSGSIHRTQPFGIKVGAPFLVGYSCSKHETQTDLRANRLWSLPCWQEYVEALGKQKGLMQLSLQSVSVSLRGLNLAMRAEQVYSAAFAANPKPETPKPIYYTP